MAGSRFDVARCHPHRGERRRTPLIVYPRYSLRWASSRSERENEQSCSQTRCPSFMTFEYLPYARPILADSRNPRGRFLGSHRRRTSSWKGGLTDGYKIHTLPPLLHKNTSRFARRQGRMACSNYAVLRPEQCSCRPFLSFCLHNSASRGPQRFVTRTVRSRPPAAGVFFCDRLSASQANRV